MLAVVSDVCGWLKDKWVRSCGIFSHDLSISRNGCFKDVGIYALLPQKAVCTFSSFESTDNATECMAKSAAKSGALIRRKKKPGFGCDRKDIF